MWSRPEAVATDPAASPAHRDAYAGLLGRLEALQDDLLEHWRMQAESSFQSFVDGWSKAFRMREDRKVRCQVCGSPEMMRLVYESPVLPLVQRLDHCPRCTEVRAGPYVDQFSWRSTATGSFTGASRSPRL